MLEMTTPDSLMSEKSFIANQALWLQHEQMAHLQTIRLKRMYCLRLLLTIIVVVFITETCVTCALNISLFCNPSCNKLQ